MSALTDKITTPELICGPTGKIIWPDDPVGTRPAHRGC